MGGRVCCNVDCFDLLIFCDHFLAGWISLLGSHCPCQCLTTVRIKIGSSHHFHIGMILVKERSSELAQSISGNTHLNLPVRNFLPPLGCIWVLLNFLKARDDIPIGIAWSFRPHGFPRESQ